MSKSILSASILSADFAKLGEEVSAVIDAGIDFIHFDVMDHHYVPNLSFGPIVCKALRKMSIQAPIDVHLMVTNPEDFIDSFAEAGADYITFHPDTVNNVEKTLAKIRKAGMKTGLAFNPQEKIHIDAEILKSLDLVLLMSVNPGFAGQSFIKESVAKIAQTRQLLNKIGARAMLGIDGGIKIENIAEVANAGANFFVVGSGLFHANPLAQRVEELRKAIGN